MANFDFKNLIPLGIAGVGALIAYHLLMSNKESPRLAAPGNTADYPTFPSVGINPIHPLPGLDAQIAFPHPYNHPIIPRYIGAPAYFQNSIQLDESHYNNGEWQGQQIPPLHITVSQNLPTPNTYSHHKMFFEQAPEPSSIDMGILTNIR